MKEVVVILPYVGDRVLMQLRDIKHGIDCPGCWGFFGGSIDPGENPETAARRELFEEISYQAATIRKLSTDHIPSLGNVISHSYYCALAVPTAELALREGLDLDLFSLEEVKGKRLYSKRLKELFPAVDDNYIIDTIEKLFASLGAFRGS